MKVVYSPLCDTDIRAYARYLAVCENVSGVRASIARVYGRGDGDAGRSPALLGDVDGRGESGGTADDERVSGGCDGDAGGDGVVEVVEGESRCDVSVSDDGRVVFGAAAPRVDGGMVEVPVAADHRDGVSGGGASDSVAAAIAVDGTEGSKVIGVRGPNYERNRAKRLRVKENRLARLKHTAVTVGDNSGGSDSESACAGGSVPWRSKRVEAVRRQGCAGGGRIFSDLPLEDQLSLRASYADRLKAENELKSFKAKQQLELERAKDMTQMKKRQETYLMSQTEMNKVRAEKAFATLVQTDNVPGAAGFAQTVASSGGSSGGSPVFSGVGSGTISPNSSISLAEIHALQKRELEKSHEVEKLKARLDKLQFLRPEVYKELGFLHALPPTVGTGVTVDDNGDPVGDYGDGFAGYLGDDGRFHFGENYDNY